MVSIAADHRHSSDHHFAANSSEDARRAASLPLYAQVKRQLQATITRGLQTGEILPGAFFTTEKDICREFHVSAITAKRALDELETEGLLVRQRGRGTFIAQPRIEQVLNRFYSFSGAMQAQGLSPSLRNLRIAVAMPDSRVAEALGLRGRERVVEIERVRFLKDEPFFLQTSFLPVKLFPGLDRLDHERDSLYEILSRHYQRVPSRCVDSFEPVLLHKHDARLLNAQPRMPGLRLERITFSDDLPIEFSRGIMRGDRCRLTIDLR